MKNMPFNILRHTQRERAPRIELVAASLIGIGVNTYVAYAIAYIGVTVVTSSVLRALAPKPNFGSLTNSQGILVNSREPDAPHQFVYGEVRKGGTITYLETTGESNKFLHMIVALAGHECEEIGDIYIDDEVVTLGDLYEYGVSYSYSIEGGSPVVATGTAASLTDYSVGASLTNQQLRDLGIELPPLATFVSASITSKSTSEAGFVTDAFLKEDSSPTIRVQKFDGSQTAAPQKLLEESELEGADALTENFIGNGIAYLYVRLEFDQNAYPNGIPLFTARVKGKKVYDPRTDTTAWSDNAALCIRDYITSAYGLGDSKVDDTSFSAAANICDEAVPLSGLGEISKYTANGIVSSATPHGEVLDEMVTSCGGTLFWGAGEWKLTVADYVAPTKTLTLDDLRSSISLQTRNNLRDQFNIVQGTFINKDARWITNDYPAIIGTGFIAEDGGVEQPLDLQLPFTTDSPTAQRLAKLTLYRGREQLTFTAEFGMSAFDVEVGEIIELDIDRYGWSGGKEFEVIGWQLKPNQDAGDLRVQLTLRETSEAAFSWDAEESDIIGNDTNLPDPFAGLTINNLTASGGGRTQGDGTFINSAILNWDNVASAFLDYYEVEWKPLADSVYSATTTEQSDIEISPLIDGVEYIFRVRAVTVGGVKGPYATVQFTGGGDETAPALPTNISATGHFKYITISWTNPADADLNYVEVYENDNSSALGATLVGISGGNSFQRTNLGLAQVKWYFLKAVDYSGNKSDFTTGVSAQTTYLDDPDFENGIYTLFTEQGLYAIEDYTNLPLAGDFVGQKAFNRTDGKLYDWNGSAWEPTVADVAAGSITATEIADNSISTPKLQANSVVASKIAGGTITGDKIASNTITTGLLQASGVIANSGMIVDGIITNAKIENLAVERAKIGNNAANEVIGFNFAEYNYDPSGFTDAFRTWGDEIYFDIDFRLDHEGNAATVADVIVVASASTVGSSVNNDEIQYRGLQIGPDNTSVSGPYAEDEWRSTGSSTLNPQTHIVSYSFGSQWDNQWVRAKMGGQIALMDAVGDPPRLGMVFKGYVWIRYR